MSQLKGGLTILKELVDQLPKSERKIAEYILEQPSDAILLTALMLGEKSKTSSAAVIRLCKSLGFSSFQELKLRVAGDLLAEETSEYRDIEPDESFSSIINKVTTNTIQSIKETVDMLQPESLTKAVELLNKAESIVFVGFGASYIAAKDAAQKFTRINKPAYAFADLHMAATFIANKGENDVVVGISFSGHTAEVEKLLKLAKRNSVQTVSITKYGASPITRLSDISLFTSATKEATFRSGATSSRIAQLHMIDILYMCLASSQYEQTITHLDRTREAIASMNEEKD